MQPRVSHLLVVSGVVVVLVLALVAYAGFLTSDWGSLLACTPAILAFSGIVAGMLCGMFFFETEEEEAPEEALRPDGAALIDAGGDLLVEAVHRTAIELHLRGLTR